MNDNTESFITFEAEETFEYTIDSNDNDQNLAQMDEEEYQDFAMDEDHLMVSSDQNNYSSQPELVDTSHIDFFQEKQQEVKCFEEDTLIGTQIFNQKQHDMQRFNDSFFDFMSLTPNKVSRKSIQKQKATTTKSFDEHQRKRQKTQPGDIDISHYMF